MTGFLLVRHASCDHVGRRIAGRSPGVHLDAAGERQAERLAERLAGAPLAAVCCGPLERARQTAAPLAAARGLDVTVCAALDEVDYGDWTGRALADLEHDEGWAPWNQARGIARPPGGEAMVDVVARVLAEMRALADRYPDGWVALVTHQDVIRPVLAHLMGAPLDLLLRLEVAPASVSTVVLEPWGPRIVRINDAEADPWR